jgi:hypothetical protein
MLEALELSFEPGEARFIFAAELFDLLFEFPLQAVKASDPSIAATNHSRVDEQALPMLRRS